MLSGVPLLVFAISPVSVSSWTSRRTPLCSVAFLPRLPAFLPCLSPPPAALEATCWSSRPAMWCRSIPRPGPTTRGAGPRRASGRRSKGGHLEAVHVGAPSVQRRGDGSTARPAHHVRQREGIEVLAHVLADVRPHREQHTLALVLARAVL